VVYLIGMTLFIFGCGCGLAFADIDQQYVIKSVLVHRSILTHNALLPLMLFVILRPFLFRHSFSVAGRLFLIGLRDCIESLSGD
jgi:hypothetical protein